MHELKRFNEILSIDELEEIQEKSHKAGFV